MKKKPKDLNLKKEIGLRDARCCITCNFAEELDNIVIKCKRNRKKYFCWKVCNFYKKMITVFGNTLKKT